jgi:LmbE family N-acetylglucosaminyl deacetylase
MNVLVFAPHKDDETLGLGGTISKLSQKGDNVYVCIVTKCTDSTLEEYVRKECVRAMKILGVKKVFFLDFPVLQLSSVSQILLNEKIEALVDSIKPEVLFIPHRGDIHADHRIVSASVMVVARPKNNCPVKHIFAYETLSETEWDIPNVSNLFNPTFWVDISATIEKKIEAMSCYSSQLSEFPNPRSLKAITALSELRGSTVGFKNAEAFMLIRSIVE